MIKASAAVAAVVACILIVAGPTAHAGEYRIGIGDKMRIKVYEWPDLSGEFAVGPAGSVFLSLVGEIPAENLTPPELASSISATLQERASLIDLPSATVEIIEFRPFYILGDVQNPGEYSYRPGLTVLQATSLAGGLYRRDDLEAMHLEREVVSSLGTMRLLESKVDQLRARKARLDAELSESERIDFPADLTDRSDVPLVRGLLDEERLMLELHRQSLREQLATERDVRILLEAEIESLKAQIASVGDQLVSAERELEDVRSLVSRGLAPAPRQLAVERTVAGIAGEQRSLETAILRARQGIRQSEQRSLDLVAEQRERILYDRQNAQSELEETQRRIDTAARLSLLADASARQLAAQRLKGSDEPVYRIVRGHGASAETISVGRMAQVEPGDIVEVIRWPHAISTEASGSRTSAAILQERLGIDSSVSQ